jgi:hypothetical protein
MASSGDGVGHLSSTSLVFGEGTSTPSRDGRDRKGLWTPQAIKEEIIGNSRILAEPGWDSCGSTDFNFFCFRLQISTKTGSLRFGNK